MLPHFKYQLAINCKARELLLARDGPVDMVMPLKIDVSNALLKNKNITKKIKNKKSMVTINKNKKY